MAEHLPWNYRPPQPAGTEVPKRRASKNTKRWCRGVEGRAHKLTWGWLRYYGLRSVSMEFCEVCGKHSRYIWPTINLLGPGC